MRRAACAISNPEMSKPYVVGEPARERSRQTSQAAAEVERAVPSLGEPKPIRHREHRLDILFTAGQESGRCPTSVLVWPATLPPPAVANYASGRIDWFGTSVEMRG